MDTAEYETNALVINNISSIAYAFYEPVSPPATSFGQGALEIEGALRQDGYLVHVDLVRRGLWLFRFNRKDVQAEPSSFVRILDSCGYNLSLAEEGAYEPAGLVRNRVYGPNSNTPSSSSSSASAAVEMTFRNPQFMAVEQTLDAKGPTSTSIKEAHEHMILAVLSAISSALTIQTGAIPLNSRTLLLGRDTGSPSACCSAPILASLRVYLTTTGVLVTAVSLSLVEGLVKFTDNSALPPLGVTVLAAPLGWFATYHSVADSISPSSDSAVGQSPDTQILRLRSERDEKSQPWRSMCTKILHARNISSPISGTQKWLSLQRVRRKPTESKFDGKRTPMVNASPSMSWPLSLCFCKAFSKLSVKSGSEEAPPPKPDQSYDPLSDAKTWFLGAVERDELLAKKKKEREALALRESTLPDVQQQQHANGLSPLALHRPGNAGVPPGAMYPTPPDGVQNLVGATPSMDGTVSSPGNNATTTAMVDIDATLNVPPDSFHDEWDHPVAKPERATNSFESENLFGDLGPDVFGNNDITDADFSFFDEQPGGMDLSLDLPDMPSSDATLGMPTNLGMGQIPEIKTESVEAPAPVVAQPSVFAKPELKHARSSLMEETRRFQENDSNRHRPTTGSKRPPSPFNPDTVFKRIRASLDNRKAVQQNSQLHVYGDSRFDRVNFGPTLSLVNSKYQGGRFDFSASRPQEAKPFAFNEPPTTDYLRRHGKGRKCLRDRPANVGELFARMASGPDTTSQHPSPTRIDDPPSDADEISLVSDQDDESYESEEPTSPMKPASIAKRRIDDDGASMATSLKDLECLDASSPNLSADFPQFSKSDVELPLSKYFADPEPPSSRLSLPDHDFILAAQILTDQASTTTLCLIPGSKPSLQSRLDRRRNLVGITQKSIRDLQPLLPACLEDMVEYQFRPFIEVQDVPLLGQPTRMQPRPHGVDQMKPNNLFQIPSPHFEMKRSENKLSVLPSAVTFWESLGLGPSNGAKDITSMCIFPDFAGVKDDVDGFLDRMHSVYESLKLGSFVRLTASVEFPSGLLPYPVDKTNDGTASILSPGLLGSLSKLSDILSHLPAKETNFVIYFVYSPGMSGAIVESCYAFHQLHESYKKFVAGSKKPVANAMALQLVPIDFVASSKSLVAPTPTELVRLAIETYDRCSLFGGTTPSPAVVLEQPLPRIIDFKMSTSPSASLLHENTCLHMAYAQSIDERWVTAAWTDNRGSQQMTSSYCLGRKGKGLATPLADVIHEMWETTCDVIGGLKVQWRLIITKCGFMDQVEIDLWSNLAQMESKSEARASITLTLLTVDTDPSLQLMAPQARIASSAPSFFYTTPVSTPQPSILSPEQTNNPPTPSLRNDSYSAYPTSAPTPTGTTANNNAEAESEADATLVDTTDQTWGAILSHRLSNSASLVDPWASPPALASGYLVKRSGSQPQDPPSLLEVNIVHSESSPRAYEALLREMLTYFRGLGTLARARGMTERETDVRPWHVAAAEEGCRGVYLLM